jgi:hypothetical protein
MVMGIDESGHDDAAARVDLRGVAGEQIASDGQNLLALDQHVGLRKVADLRIHRHHRAAADDGAPAGPAHVRWRPVVRRRRTRGEQIEARGDRAGRRRAFQEIAPRGKMVLWPAFIAQSAHGGVSPLQVIRNDDFESFCH